VKPVHAIAVGVVTAFWAGFDLYLLFVNPVLSSALGSDIGTSDRGFELAVFVAGTLLTLGTHHAAESSSEYD
jgi:hypothetical protein